MARGIFMAETAENCLRKSDYDRSVNSLLLLRESQRSHDPILKRRLYEQSCDQEASHIAEVLPGPLQTEFKFSTYGGELYLLQPNGVNDWLAMHKNGLSRARAMARINPALKFYERIAEAELEEAE